MRRFLRILPTAVTLLSAMLVVTTVVLWIRSEFAVDVVTCVTPPEPAPTDVCGWTIASARGSVEVIRSRMTIPALGAVDAANWDAWRKKVPAGLRWRARPVSADLPAVGSFASPHRTQDDTPVAWSEERFAFEQYRIAVPYWLPALVAGILPARVLLKRIPRRRRKFGFCPACGYDLRATPDRCPECGAIPPSMVQCAR